METKKFNKSNWSGKESTITFFKNGKFKIDNIDGYTFWLKRVAKGIYKIHGDQLNYHLGTVFLDDGISVATDDYINFDDKCRFVAAAKLLCATI